MYLNPVPYTGLSSSACINLLKDMKGVRFTLKEIEYYGYLMQVRTLKHAGQQPTVPGMVPRLQQGEAEASGGGDGAVRVVKKKVSLTKRVDLSTSYGQFYRKAHKVMYFPMRNKMRGRYVPLSNPNVKNILILRK